MARPPAFSYPCWYHDRCAETLELALRLPAYASWRSRDPDREVPILRRLARLPITTKSQLREHFPGGFVEPGRDVEAALAAGDIEYVKTSGTTSEQLTNIWYQPWWNASERQSWQWNSHAAALPLGQHREALLASARSVGVLSESQDLSFEQRQQGRFLFLSEKVSPALWQPHHLSRMVAEINRFAPQVLEGNPSFLQRLARHVVRERPSLTRPSLVVLSYELATQRYRRVIAEAFGAPLCSSYGATEAGYVFTECEAGRMHQNIESCHVDFEPFAADHGGPLLGRVLVTTFGNPWRVLVRFDVGDLARLEPVQGRCPCGRTQGMTLAAIEGRCSGLTLTTDGRAVTQAMVDAALDGVEGIHEWQVEQTQSSRYELRLVCAAGGSDGLRAQAREAIAGLYGPRADVRVASVDALAAEVSGKYRLCKAAFPIDVESMLDRGGIP